MEPPHAAQTSQLSTWPPLGKTTCINKAESRSRSLFLQPEREAEYLSPTYQATSLLVAVCLPPAALLPTACLPTVYCHLLSFTAWVFASQGLDLYCCLTHPAQHPALVLPCLSQHRAEFCACLVIVCPVSFPGHQQKVFCSTGRDKLWKCLYVTETPAREVSTP